MPQPSKKITITKTIAPLLPPEVVFVLDTSGDGVGVAEAISAGALYKNVYEP